MQRSWLAAALGLLPFCTLGGQVQVTADVGSSVLRQTGLPESAVFTAGADLRWLAVNTDRKSTRLNSSHT